MSSQETEIEHRVVAVVVIFAVLLAVGLAMGFGIHKVRSGAAGAGASAAATAPADPASAAAASASAAVAGGVDQAMPGVRSEDASVVVENGVVMFYFATGKAELATGAVEVLADAIAAASSGKRLVISGFHDATGDPAFNIELAKQRAMAVRDALVGAGVAPGSVELKKPEETTGTGNLAQARRVEVVIAD
ncbi:MAG: OmpA family protein [Hydrogenophaga sp.]|jgi:outer membrane protein OmpA-like peptidoglycan-associated protein|nr:OmpA family protein [Hydrogenophaga sp.]